MISCDLWLSDGDFASSWRNVFISTFYVDDACVLRVIRYPSVKRLRE